MTDFMEVEAPDGQIVEFPVGTDDATIDRVMSQMYSQGDSGAQAAPLPVAGSMTPPKAQNAPAGPQTESGGILSVAADVATNTMKGAKEAYTGEGQQLEFPDAGEITDIEDIGFLESFIPTLKLGLSYSAEGKAGIIADHFKDDPRFGGSFKDKYENPLIVWNGKPYYTNKPGFSTTDANDVLGGAAMFTPAGRAAGTGANMISRAAIALPAYGGTDALRQYAGNAAGSSEAVSLDSAGQAGAFGATAEAFLPPALRVAGRAVRSALPKKAPIRPGFVIPPGIPRTQGQTTMSLPQLRAEEAMRQGARGQAAESTMRQFDAKQLDAINTSASNLESRIGAGAGLDPHNVTAMGTRLQDDFTSAANQSRQAVRSAYDAANASNASLGPETVLSIADDLSKITKEMNLPTTKGMNQLNAVLDQLESFKALGKRANLKALDVSQIERFRQSLNAGMKSAQGGEYAALARMKSVLDQRLSDAIDQGLMNGDAATLDLFKKARSLRTLHAQLFEAGKHDPAGNAMVKILDEKRATPVQVVNYLVNLQRTGSQHVTKGLIDRTVQAFGRNSEQVKLLKSAYLMKAFGEPLNLKSGETARIAIVRNARNLLDWEGKAIADTLFTADEKQAIKAFANEVAPTITPADAKNPSRSAWAFTRELVERGLIPAAAGKVGNAALSGSTMIPFLGPMASGYRNTVARNSAEQAISGLQKALSEPMVSAGMASAAQQAWEAR
ncbi:MAG: hypothetical protein RIM72_22355 [Alphaproteobacteria bacterium]